MFFSFRWRARLAWIQVSGYRARPPAICFGSREGLEFPRNPLVNNRGAESPELANMDTLDESTSRILLKCLWCDTDDRGCLIAVDQRFRNCPFTPAIGFSFRIHTRP